MASLWDRFLNVFDDHLEREREAETVRVTERIRDTLLGKSLDIKDQWTESLVNLRGLADEEEIRGYYQETIRGINAGFDALREVNPTISSKIDADDFAQSSERNAHRISDGLSSQLQPEVVRVTEQLADNLVKQGLTVREEWVAELGVTQGEDEIASSNGYYRGRVEEINNSFSSLREINPAIIGRLDANKLQFEALNNVGKDLTKADYERGLSLNAMQLERDHDLSLNRGPDREFSLLREMAQTGIVLPVTYGKEHEKSLEISTALSGSGSSEAAQRATEPAPDLSISNLLHDQEQTIRNEWQKDLELRRDNQHALESYFAGRIDQHNTLLEMAVEAHPELQQTLPPTINYIQLRDELQQQIEVAKGQQVSTQTELAAAGFGMSI